MKKVNFIIPVVIILSFNLSFAQSITVSNLKKVKANQSYITNEILKKQMAKNNTAKAKTSSELAQRLVGISAYSLDSITSLIDTERFVYSSSRTSIFNYNTMGYDNSYVINGANLFGFGSEVGFFDHNDAPDIACDSSELWYWDSVGMSLVLYDLRVSSYDTNYNLTEYTDLYQNDTSVAIYYDNRYINWFDSYGNISSSLAMSQDLPTWDTSEFRIFTYDMAHSHVIEDSTNVYTAGTWMPEEKWLYTFNDSGYMTEADYYMFTGTTWQETEIYNMAYYSDYSLKIDSASLYSDTAWIPVIKDSFGYTAGLTYANYVKEFLYDFGTFAGYIINTKHITSSLPDTLYSHSYKVPGDTLIIAGKTAFSYDSYEEPITATQYNFNITDTGTGAGWYDTTVDDITYYYYELYYERPAHNAVPNIPPTTEQVNVYPNPTTNALNICRPNAVRGAYTLIKLINAGGQTVHTESLPWQSETETVSMAGLPPGVYWLTIQDRVGNVVYKQSIIKE